MKKLIVLLSLSITFSIPAVSFDFGSALSAAASYEDTSISDAKEQEEYVKKNLKEAADKKAALKRSADAKEALERAAGCVKRNTALQYWLDMRHVFKSSDVPKIVRNAQKAYNKCEFESAFSQFSKCSIGRNYPHHCKVYMGMMLLNGIGTKQNTRRAKTLLEETLRVYTPNLPTEQLRLAKRVLSDAKYQFNEELKEQTALKIEKQEADAKRNGYTSYAIMQKDIKKKADTRKKEEKERAVTQARKVSKNNPGFRDLKPAMYRGDYIKNCIGSKCYGIQNISFSPHFKNKNGIKVVSYLTLDMGPIASDGILIDLINEFADPDANIFRKMKTNFDTKYILEYEFSQRDRQLFNEREKSELLVVYSKGQVVLRITRDFSLYIEYRDISEARAFLKRNKPVTAAIDDF